MLQHIKKKHLVLALAVFMVFNLPSSAKNVGLQDLEGLSIPDNTKIAVVGSGQVFDKDHWAYQTLENISRKYGLLVGKPNEHFDGSKPLSRNEAAVLLVNLTGKIEQSKVKLGDTEKAQIDILRRELKNDLNQLTGRVDTIESSVNTIKGSISKLEEADKKDWNFDFGEKFKINGAFQARYAGVTGKGTDAYSPNFKIPLSELIFSGKLHPHIKYVINPKFERTFTSSSSGLLGDAYISTDIIPHHTVYFGQTRVPIGQEGTMSSSTLETIDRAQIARNFSDLRDLGIKMTGNWGLIDYTFATFNGNGQNKVDTNNDLNLTAWGVVKPLYKLPQLGKLELGGGYNIGKNATYRQDTVSLYGGYKYKRYAIKSEYAWADGYSAYNRRAEGLYIHNALDLTKKMQLVARYDWFNPNASTGKDAVTEYTLGSNYYLSGQNLKLQLNLVLVDNQSGKNSERIGILTQYKF